MGKQSVLAYSVAGVAVAIAIAVVSATTLGLAGATGSEGAPVEFVSDSASLPFESIDRSGNAIPGADAVEYVYVDEPGVEYDDDDDDEQEHDRGHNDNDDDDDRSRGDHDDDDD